MNGRGMGARDGSDKRYPAPEPKRTAVGGTRRGGEKRGRDEIEGGPKELRIGGSGEPSSARNRPAGKRDTTGRLHYRAPTCFLSPRRGLSPLRPTLPLSPPSPRSTPRERTARFAFLLCMRQPILPSNSVYTNPFRRFPLFCLGHRTQFSSGSRYARSLDSL